jgi:hypothetical protein
LLISAQYRWMGEKYDGVRVCWNALQDKLYLLKIGHFIFFIFSYLFIIFY